MAIQIKMPLLSVELAKKRKKVWIASRHASLAVAMTGAAIAFFNSLLKRFRRRPSHLKRSISLLLRNSGRETGSHPGLRGGMLSLELLYRPSDCEKDIPSEMASILIVALTMAGFALLALAERLGLPALLVRPWLVGLVLALLAALSLSAATSRLPAFLEGRATPERKRTGRFPGVLALHAGLILTLVNVLGLQTMSLAGLALVLMVYGTALTVLPAGSLPQLSTSMARQAMRGDISGFIQLASALIAGVFALWLLPQAVMKLQTATGWPPDHAWVSSLAIIAVPVLFGGLSGVLRLGAGFIAVLVLVSLVPLAFALAHHLPSSDIRAVASVLDAAALGEGILALLKTQEGQRLVLAAIMAALVARMAHPALSGSKARFSAVAGGILLALAIALLAHVAQRDFNRLVLSELPKLMPQDWPLFVFEDTIRGWLSLCGRVVQGALDGVEACRAKGIGLPPPAAALIVEPRLFAPAFAASQNWPVVLGWIWGLSGPIILLITLGFMLHGATSGLSETLGFRLFYPEALQSARLGMARITVLGGVFGLSFIGRGVMPDEALLRFVALGLVFLVAAALIAHLMLMVLRVFRPQARL